MMDSKELDEMTDQAAKRIADMIVQLINICGEMLHTAKIMEVKRG